MPKIHVVGLILCERFEVKPEPALVGLVQALRFSSFPSRPKILTAYTGLYGRSVEGTIELRITRLEGERDVYIHKKWIAFPSRFTTINLVLPIGCIFPAAGLYSVSLRFDEEVIVERILEVFAE